MQYSEQNGKHTVVECREAHVSSG